ncbi:MAG: CBS domain-containing protein [Phycisphaerae bacterium]|nr:CBS domain-containing protein [Phycisphaerae bacterium]
MFKARDVMTGAAICARPEMSIYDAVRLLAGRNITGMPVVDEDLNLIGVLSEKDVLKMLYTEDSIGHTVSDYMNTDPVSLPHDASLVDVCDCLIENNFRRVFITEDGVLAGVTSRSDVIRAILRLKHQELRD